MKKLLIFFFFYINSLSILFAQNTTEVRVKQWDLEAFKAALSRTSDSIVVYNFWATWCKPCVEEIPEFVAFFQKYQNSTVTLKMVSCDFSNELNSKLIPFLKKRRLKFPVFLLTEPDPNKWINLVSESWEGNIPATLVRNERTGKSLFFARKVSFSELEQAVKQVE